MDTAIQAVDDLVDQLAPETKDFRWLNERLSDLAILLALTASPQSIGKWVEVVIRQVAHLPRIALCDALDEALVTCRYTNEVVPMLVKRVDEITVQHRKCLRELRVLVEAGQIDG